MITLGSEEIKALRDIIIRGFGEIPNIKRNFAIQHTFFEVHGKWWHMNLCLQGGEYLHEINVEENNETFIEITHMWGKPDEIKLQTSIIDKRGCSTKEIIYACDLFEDFVPKHYKGKCVLASDFNGTGGFEITGSKTHEEWE